MCAELLSFWECFNHPVMNNCKPILVVLGNNLTALAVVRAAHKLGVQPVLFDHEPGLAFKTRLAQKALCQSRQDEEIVSRLSSLPGCRDGYLIAVSDDWIRFIIRHREQLDTSFKKVLHARNEALRTCLDKDEFAAFCGRHGLPAPRFYDQTGETEEVVRFPVMVRPGRSSVGLESGLPKAKQIDDEEELRDCREQFRRAKVPCIITESLLHLHLKKYSVAVARSGNRIVSFVAEQVRPTPQDCAVGTYVRLSRDCEAETLAKRTAELLDYFGIGELEILYSQDNGRYYLIEFNARPWLQYTLAEDSNHRMLQFLIDPEEYQAEKEKKIGENWLWFEADLFVCFSRSIGYIWSGRIGWADYVCSLATVTSRPVLHWLDPLPAVHAVREMFATNLGKRFKGWRIFGGRPASRQADGKTSRQKPAIAEAEAISRPAVIEHGLEGVQTGQIPDIIDRAHP